MNSRFWTEVAAIWRKEFRSEFRSKQGFFTAGLFSLIAVVAVAFASAEQRPNAALYAGMLTIVMLFSASITLPRLFLVEDDQRTMDLLRLLARPEAAFWGKFLFAFAQLILTATFLVSVFVGLTGVQVGNVSSLFAGLLLESLTLAATISVTGVLVVGTSQRWILGSVVSLPLLLPQVSLSIGVFQHAFGEGAAPDAWQNMGGLALFGLAMLSFGPVLAHFMWRLDSGVARGKPRGS